MDDRPPSKAVPITNPPIASWHYVIPRSATQDTFRADLAAAQFLLIEEGVAVQAYFVSSFATYPTLKAYVEAEAGYADPLVAVARLDTTLVRRPGEPLRLEDVLR